MKREEITYGASHCGYQWGKYFKFDVAILHFEYSVLSTSSDCNVDLCPAVCVLIFPSLSKDIERHALLSED